jgi:hypothetical protein
VEGARWDDLDVATDAIFAKKADAPPPASGPLSSFDFDGSLDLVARLQKAAAVPSFEGKKAPPFEKKDGDKSDKKDEAFEGKKAPPFEKKDGDDQEEKTAEIASAAVLRQAISDVCSVLAGGEPSLDKVAGVVVAGLLEGHTPTDLTVFLAGMEKQAIWYPFKSYMPWADLPGAGAATNIRRTLWRTPEEKNIQAESRLSRAEAKSTSRADRQLLKDQTLYANRAAARAPADAAERVSQLRVMEGEGLPRSQAEKILSAKDAAREKAFLAKAREAHGLDRNKFRLGIGNTSFDVNKRVLTKTAPLLMGAAGLGWALGHRRDPDDDRRRGIMIS